MEDATPFSSFATLLIIFLLMALKFLLHAKTKQHKNLPPSPPAFPIIGNLHLLKQPLHQTLHTLSQKYGPIISLQLGTRNVVIVSSPSAVEECFTKNDIVFANRPPLIISKYLGYNHTTLAASSYGDHWRNLRRIGAIEIFSSSRLNMFIESRRDEVNILLKKIYSISSNGFAKVELKKMFLELTFNIVMRMVSGKRYFGEDVMGSDEARQFRETITEGFKCSDVSYAGDFLPFLQWFDYEGYMKRLASVGARTDMLLQGIIDEHRSEKDCLESRNTMVSHLLKLQESQSEYYTDEIIKGLILNVIFGGTETTATTLEWAMSNLLNHLEILEKARNELHVEIGHEGMIHESHLSKLPYLQNVISETLRMYPPGPLLLPHLSSNECTVGGYHVPPNTILFVNAWAIQRDTNLWDDALNFKPERFERGPADSYNFMPFGIGRRMCPGVSLANRVVGLTLGSLIQCFDWKRVTENEIGMSEGNGLTMPKAEPLVAMCKARNVMISEACSSI